MTKHFRPYYNFTRSTEGGMTHQMVKDLCSDVGIEIKIGGSPYVGMSCVYLRTEDKRKLARLERALS